MGAGHSHGSADTRVSRMIIASAILGVFFVVELTTALMINSLALLADATHMLTDLVALFMGLTAVLLARRGSKSPARTYGWHRAEVFTAVANAVLLLGVAGFILYEAIERLGRGRAGWPVGWLVWGANGRPCAIERRCAPMGGRADPNALERFAGGPFGPPIEHPGVCQKNPI